MLFVCLTAVKKHGVKNFFRRLIIKKQKVFVMFNATDIQYSQWMWNKIFWKRKFKKRVLSEDCEVYTHSIKG